MLESLTIFSKGGLILYQHVASPSLLNPQASRSDAVAFVQEEMNHVLSTLILTGSTKTYHIKERTTFCWVESKTSDSIGMALYPDIMFEGPRQYLKEWVQKLLHQTLEEYAMFTTSQTFTIRPNPTLFDATFQALLQASKGRDSTSNNSTTQPQPQPQPSKAGKKLNEKNGTKGGRTWHDGKNKVTEATMAALDQSTPDCGDSPADGHARALAEARAAYLPTETDLRAAQEAVAEPSLTEDSASSSWGSSVTGLLQSWTGNKSLTDADLDKPLKQLHTLLTQKNVAEQVAAEICTGIRKNLRGKKLNSLHRVQTAVQQAMTSSLTKILQSDTDLLRNALRKRDGLSLTTKKRPYVVGVMGINGVGKSTSLAKLAYYYKQNGCRPMLVAGDTFRSGAVEQLKVHADCLDVPMFAQGYSKDPSSVAQAAIQEATTQGNDVVLIDTAGRMQNNVPLMKALAKLVKENKPDFMILVAEALVGHDGQSQFDLFSSHVPVNGILLTKFDTVSDKVGAALTLTHQTHTPVVFTGVGQKYHHLQKLSAPQVIRSLMA